MNSKMTVWFSLAATLAPTLMWGVAGIMFMTEAGSKGLPALVLGALWMGAPIARIFINLGWVAHVIMSKRVDQTHKVFWALGFLIEAFCSMCLGLFSIIGLIYWFKEAYGPYRDEQFNRAMREASM